MYICVYIYIYSELARLCLCCVHAPPAGRRGGVKSSYVVFFVADGYL